jgi:SpoVK/Ycf46/Vps4 family AAA+-type ATPase
MPPDTRGAVPAIPALDASSLAEDDMARADLLLDIVRAGAEGNQELFRKALEAIVAEERGKQHNVLADQLVAHLKANGPPLRPMRPVLETNGERAAISEVRPRRQLSDLVLPDVVRQACEELVEEHHRADLLRAHNIEPRHRVLLSGPPGNGKTTLAEALAFELRVPLYIVRYESIIGSYLGETAVRLAKLFAQVRSERCVLFFDEFDVVGKERGDVHETGEIKRVVSSLLLQVDQLPSHVVVVAATNHSELLDRAAWRRFQLRLTLPLPSKEQRVEWLRQFERRAGFTLGYSYDHLAKVLGAISFAELELFALDVKRRYVLALPEGDIRSIVDGRLKQWAARVKPQRETARKRNG